MKTKRELIESVYWHDVKADAWLDTIPREIRDSFIDNPYVENLRTIINTLMKSAFSDENELRWIEWLFYDWNYSRDLSITIDYQEYRFETFDEALDKFFELELIKE